MLVESITQIPHGFLQSCKSHGVDTSTSIELAGFFREYSGRFPFSYGEILEVLE